MYCASPVTVLSPNQDRPLLCSCLTTSRLSPRRYPLTYTLHIGVIPTSLRPRRTIEIVYYIRLGKQADFTEYIVVDIASIALFHLYNHLVKTQLPTEYLEPATCLQ